MPVYNCTMFMELGKYGWSESHHLEATDASKAMVVLRALASKRQDVFDGLVTEEHGFYVAYLRVSDVAIKRDSLLEAFNPSDGLKSAPAGGATTKKEANTEPPFVSIAMRIQADQKHWRTLHLRGLVDLGYTNDTGKVKDNTAIIKSVEKYGKELVKAGFKMKGADYDGLGQFRTIKRILPIPAGGGEPALATIDTGTAGLVPGDMIQLAGKGLPPAIRGKFRIYSTTGEGNYNVIPKQALPARFDFIGTWRKAVDGYFAYQSVTAERVTKRNTGVPFALPVGRRKAKA